MTSKTDRETLADIVGQDQILDDPYDLDRYSVDALAPARAFGAESAFESLAALVVRPESASQISQILAWAQSSGTPVIPYGGGTGVMGGVLPVRGGVILDLARLNNILEINPQNMTATVQPCVIIEDLEDKLFQQGLMPGHDPYSVAIATVAGTISTNGVGYRAGAYGPMGNQVVSLEAVLPDGRIINTRPVPKASSGPNLNHLFIGGEGVFGVITRATIKVFPLPEKQVFATFGFDTFEQGFAAAAEIRSLGIQPTLLDLTEEGEQIRLFLLFEGYMEGVDAEENRTKSICIKHGGRDLGPEPTLEYWADRHESGENYKRTALGRPREERWRHRRRRGWDYLHLGLPIDQVLEYRRQADRILASHQIQVIEYALWSRPEFFSMMVIPEDSSAENSRDQLAKAVDEVLKLAQDMGGVMEYCHGIGVKLNHLLARELGVGHDVITQLKATLDPANILNPGKLGM